VEAAAEIGGEAGQVAGKQRIQGVDVSSRVPHTAAAGRGVAAGSQGVAGYGITVQTDGPQLKVNARSLSIPADTIYTTPVAAITAGAGTGIVVRDGGIADRGQAAAQVQAGSLSPAASAPWTSRTRLPVDDRLRGARGVLDIRRPGGVVSVRVDVGILIVVSM